MPDDAVPDDAVPDDLVPVDAVPDDLVPVDAVPDDLVPDDVPTGPRTHHRRTAVAGVAAALVLALTAWFWWTSLVPATYSVMGMGYVDAGGGEPGAGHATHDPLGQPGDVSVAGLTGPADDAPDLAATLEAAAAVRTLRDGTTFAGYTIGGSSPGPTLEVTQGDLVEVTLVNASVPDGVTLHWHGVDVPNAEDGVAGVTQDAVPEGGRHVYRFRADDAGTYWYHSHQVSHRQVRLGIFGALVVHPAAGADPGVAETVAVAHSFGATPTLDGVAGDRRHVVAPGAVSRVRVVNTNSSAMRVWVAGASYRLLAVDGTDVAGPTPVTGEAVLVAAGGRADLEVVSPADGTAARVRLGAGGTDVVVGPEGSTVAPGTDLEDPGRTLDLLRYGTPSDPSVVAADPDRTFRYAIGRRFGFVDGRPGLHWTVNGHMFPDVPMFTVSEGDVVRMTISNTSGQSHPMHLHGHHVLVLSRDGEPATGSPWWTDSLEVRHGQTYEVAFLADNPGVWMDHCHNLPHAEQGLVAHLMYTGVTSPYTVGGTAANAPE